jgi:hypothetical protein
MTITGVTILAILRQLDCNYTSIEPFWLPGPVTLAVSLATPTPVPVPGPPGIPRSPLLRGRRGGGLRPIWALIPGHSLKDLSFVGARDGGGSGNCCRGGRVLPCKQLTHRHQDIDVVSTATIWG